MNYILKEKHPQKPYSNLSCIVSWNSLDAYLLDCDTAYAALPATLKHGKPETAKMRTPDESILEKLQNFRTKFSQSKFVKTRKIDWDISGGALDIPTALAGIPEHFQIIRHHYGKAVKLVFSPEVHVDTTQCAMRGAAILSLVQSLEQKGHRVECWVGWDNTVSGEKYESRILIKKQGQRLNIVSLAAPFCDEDFLRTCEFNLIAHFLRTTGVGRNYGITLKGDIVLDGSYKSMSHFSSEESCLKWIEQMKQDLATGKGIL